ncbi:MAG: hypothetical protein ACM3VV_08445 [Deltaproteobacteria bacterium]
MENLKQEIESKAKNLKELEKTETDYKDKLNLKSIKLTKLQELENAGFGIEDLKKLKRALIEITKEHTLNSEQMKDKFFNDLENYENKIASENEIKKLLEQISYLQKQIENKRLILSSQELVGPLLRNLLDIGIQENDIISILILVNILQDNKNGNTEFNYFYKEIRQQIVKDLSTYSNLRLALTRLKQETDKTIQNNNLNNL